MYAKILRHLVLASIKIEHLFKYQYLLCVKVFDSGSKLIATLLLGEYNTYYKEYYHEL